MKHRLKNGRSVEVRLLKNSDSEKLFEYFEHHFSKESKSRFGPHPFDKETINAICQNPNGEITRYVATDEQENIVAYMLIKQGMIEWDMKRYGARQQSYDHNTSITFAPSVADAWQSSGVGSLMNCIIEDELRRRKIQNIILWGGVQATNEKAVNFYKKLGYQFIASFWHDGKDNHDMVKQLS
jgi:ribosomal protein S18 acetylase RimI-like enzyme